MNLRVISRLALHWFISISMGTLPLHTDYTFSGFFWRFVIQAIIVSWHVRTWLVFSICFSRDSWLFTCARNLFWTRLQFCEWIFQMDIGDCMMHMPLYKLTSTTNCKSPLWKFNVLDIACCLQSFISWLRQKIKTLKSRLISFTYAYC